MQKYFDYLYLSIRHFWTLTFNLLVLNELYNNQSIAILST